MSLFHKFRVFSLEWGWEEIVPSGGTEPSGNRGGAMFARDGSGKFVLVGGRTQAGSDLSDYWSFDYAGTRQWTQVVASGLANVVSPSGYADGSGNILIAGNDRGQWANNVASTQLSKIAVSTGSQTALTDSGTGVVWLTGPALTADIASKAVFVAGGSASQQPGYVLGKGVQDTSGNTNARSSLTSSALTRSQESSPAYYPAGNALYMLAPSRTYTSGAWTLGTGDIIRYDLASPSGWVAETGITNSVGSVPMPYYPTGITQMVWCAAEAKFFLFLSTPGDANGGVGRVLTYDPSSKNIGEALFSGQGSAYVLGSGDSGAAERGNVGTVVCTGSDFYFITAWGLSSITNARIWKFRRN